jgi:hypothetical protein
MQAAWLDWARCCVEPGKRKGEGGREEREEDRCLKADRQTDRQMDGWMDGWMDG